MDNKGVKLPIAVTGNQERLRIHWKDILTGTGNISPNLKPGSSVLLPSSGPTLDSNQLWLLISTHNDRNQNRSLCMTKIRL